ncbi:helix-turn-helix domain-containing protein [Infirmifilum lucidum]|uniref:Helix-turn-helix domain-containing protein n=1 Tax=Infirmifilum lucidum TaxID=2776706 RepID=A0A7L9FEG7_9CREN|nr:ArsR family transcriptional regulator [Infirmifilum lucidum]QOJ78190.1 helix-turn-helix domain-containing protein [Infirmifilum lucidum]
MSKHSRRAREIGGILEVLSNPVRVEILRLLMESPKRYSEIAERVGVSQAGLAHHIKKLESKGLVEHRGEVYGITQLGKNILAVIDNIEIAAVGDLSVITRWGFSLPLKYYVETFLRLHGVVTSGRCSQQKILGMLADELQAEGYSYGYVLQQFVDSFLHWVLAKNHCIYGKNVQSQFTMESYEAINPHALDVLAESGLLDLLASNLIVFSAGWTSGASALYMPYLSPPLLKLVFRRREAFPELVVNARPDLDSGAEKALSMLFLTDSGMPVTYLVDASDNEDFLQRFLSDMVAHLPHSRSMVVVYGWERIRDEITLLLTRLINNGVPLVFTSSDVFPSLRSLAFPRGEAPTLHLGAVTFPMPIVLSQTSIRDTSEFIGKTVQRLEKIVQYLKKQSTRVARILELENTPPVDYVFQISLAGFEGGIILKTPSLRELFSETNNYKRIVIRKILDEYFATSKIQELVGVKVVDTFYTPSSNLSMLIALRFKQHHLDVNPLSPFSFNSRTRSTQDLLELESGIQTVLGGIASILELRVRGLTAIQLKEIISRMQKAGLKQFTVTIVGLHVCNVCGNIVHAKVSRCPRCYSRELSELSRYGLAYVQRDSLDPWALEEVENRVVAQV